MTYSPCKVGLHILPFLRCLIAMSRCITIRLKVDSL
jgi:hypothetical protein